MSLDRAMVVSMKLLKDKSLTKSTASPFTDIAGTILALWTMVKGFENML